MRIVEDLASGDKLFGDHQFAGEYTLVRVVFCMWRIPAHPQGCSGVPPRRRSALVALHDLLRCYPLRKARPERDIVAKTEMLYERNV